MQINDFRLTFIWVETLLDALTATPGTFHPVLPIAIVREPYIDWFDSAHDTRPRPDEPAPPWPAHKGQGFWARYLGADPAVTPVSGRVAWRECVPVRLPRPVAVDGTAFPTVRAYTEGFVHPWGFALVVNVVSTEPWVDMTDLTAHVADWRREAWFVVRGLPTSLDAVAIEGLSNLRDKTFGGVDADPGIGEPFSVFTPVRGTGTKVELDPSSDVIHRLLQTGASLTETWAWDDLEPLDQMRVAGRKIQPKIHTVFGATRGRSIWGPAYLAQPKGKHTLSCQHRNLVLASAMTQSLAQFAGATVSLGPSNMLGDHSERAKRAMEVLGAMYLGSRYRTGSVKAQIDQGGWLGPINAVRAQLALAAL